MSLFDYLENSAIEQPAKRGRPLKTDPDRQVLGRERRIGMLAAAGMSGAAIAIQLETNLEYVLDVLKRPAVARFITRVSTDIVNQVSDTARNISNELEAVAGEALDRQVNVMRILDETGDDALLKGDLKNGIRAKLGVVTTTQDILDRAGKRAPTRSVAATIHAVNPDQLDRLERIFGEANRPKSEVPQVTGALPAPITVEAELYHTLPQNGDACSDLPSTQDLPRERSSGTSEGHGE